MDTGQFKNVAGYLFADLPSDTIRGLRESIYRECLKAEVRGTILLSAEGVNVALSGPENGIDRVIDYLSGVEALRDLECKVSWSAEIAFNRLLVKIKREIIATGDGSIRPNQETGRRMPPEVLKEWLDEGRDFLLLDTRNRFEVDLGTFSGAQHLDLDSFRQIADRLKGLADEPRDSPAVMFCTGGIRCEKASVMLMRLGFREVYQLDGGILSYFEKCGGSHYEGECFVFDKRVAVDHDLVETTTSQCYSCRHPLSAEDREHRDYEYGSRCRFCAA